MNIQLKFTDSRKSAYLSGELLDSLIHAVEGVLLAEYLRKFDAAAGSYSLAAQRNAQRVEVQSVLYAVRFNLLKERRECSQL